ncbi:MAG: hypothetical protein KAH01_07190, partial [Caldisericia bacterium]|nr:hypothetical protein [Caldisericia bacterium]
SNDWWGMINHYNENIYPLQFVIMALGIALCAYLLFGDKNRGSFIAKIYLALCNLWIGIGFFLVLGSALPAPTRQIQGALFIFIGLLFVVDIFTNVTTIAIPKKGPKRTITMLLLFIVMLYPVVGLLLGRNAHMIIYPGTLPCATTALSLVLLNASLPKASKLLFIPLLIWAIPFPLLIQIPKYHVYEDGIMFLIGIYALFSLVVYRINKCF